MKAGRRQIRLMGTVIDFLIYHEKAERLLDETDRLLRLYERRFSANRQDSELMQINHQAGLAPVSVSPDLYELIQLGKEHSCAPGSRLNIAIGPLVQLWRIGFSDARVPSQAEIDRKRQLIDPEQIILKEDERSVLLKEKGMLIDLGALAKGYIADKIMAYLKAEKVVAALINLGGNVLTWGPALHNDDQLWRVGIQNPAEKRGTNSLVLQIRSRSVVTSGIYERKLETGDRAYHHILSSETGYPAETDTASLTILSDKSVEGEIWTTRLFGQPLNRIRQELASQPHLSGLAIKKNGEICWLNSRS